VLTGSILQTVSVVSVVSSFQPRVMDETASENTCAELCALPILRMFTFWVQLADVGEIVDTRKARITLKSVRSVVSRLQGLSWKKNFQTNIDRASCQENPNHVHTISGGWILLKEMRIR
jgi:hypothetical protein